MFNPFDVTMKNLVEKSPSAWLRFVGVTSTNAQLLEDEDLAALDTDLTTVTTTCDKVFRVTAPSPFLLHIEFESEGRNVPARVHRYGVLLDYKYDPPVQSVVVLLRQQADQPEITGRVERFRPNGRCYLYFEYEVVRVWQIPVEQILEGEIGILPLAPISSVSESDLPEVLRRMEQRVDAELTADERDDFWTYTYLMMGLRYRREQSINLLKGVVHMTNSTTYMAILEEGEARGEAHGRLLEGRNLILRQGRKRFGEPSDEIVAQLNAINSVETIEALAERLLDVENWQDLFA
jgi:predicted transposase YdaD